MTLTGLRWPRGFRRRQKAGVLSGPAAVPVAGISLFELWDLESAFQHAFENFNALTAELLSACLGQAMAGRFDFGDQIKLLEDVGLLDRATMSSWADCLAVRRAFLRNADHARPAPAELALSVQIMNRLNAHLADLIRRLTSAGAKTR